MTNESKNKWSMFIRSASRRVTLSKLGRKNIVLTTITALLSALGFTVQ